MGLAMAAMLPPAALLAQDAAYLPCLSRHATADELRANFVAAGWQELTDDADRRLAASAIGEVEYLTVYIPPQTTDANEIDALLVLMHRFGLRLSDISALLYFHRSDDYARVEPAGVPAGFGTATRCYMVGTDLRGARTALDDEQMTGDSAALRIVAVDTAEMGQYEDLRIDATEHLFDAPPTETLYGPLGFIVTYKAAPP